MDKKVKSVSFPFHLRIPEWCKNGIIKINGKVFQESAGNKIVKISREWKTGDVVELELAMHVFKIPGTKIRSPLSGGHWYTP